MYLHYQEWCLIDLSLLVRRAPLPTSIIFQRLCKDLPGWGLNAFRASKKHHQKCQAIYKLNVTLSKNAPDTQWTIGVTKFEVRCFKHPISMATSFVSSWKPDFPGIRCCWHIFKWPIWWQADPTLSHGIYASSDPARRAARGLAQRSASGTDPLRPSSRSVGSFQSQHFGKHV